MTRPAGLLALAALLGLCACGDSYSSGGMTSEAPIALEGGSWEGTPMDPTTSSEKVRVLAFFMPT